MSYRQDKDLQHFLKEFNSLALLPAEDIEGGFNGLRARVGEFPDFEEPLADFCSYHERFWLRQIRPEGFSVFGLDDRTNNTMESYHAVLKHVLGAKAPWWPIMEFLRNSQSLWKVDFDSIRKGHVHREPGTKRRQARQKLIRRFMTEFAVGILSVPEFLDKTARLSVTFRHHVTEGWQDGIIVTVSVNDLPHEVSLNEGVVSGDSGDSDGDEPPPGPPQAPAAAPAQAPPQAPGEEDLQVMGHDSVEAVLQSLENPDALLNGVLEDMGMEDNVFNSDSDTEIVPSSQPVAQ